MINELQEFLTDRDFDGKISNQRGIIVVNLWAPWCGPCKYLNETMKEVIPVYLERIKFYIVNVDDNPLVAGKFGIKAIPALLFFKDGKLFSNATEDESGIVIGMMSQKKLVSHLDKLLSQ